MPSIWLILAQDSYAYTEGQWCPLHESSEARLPDFCLPDFYPNGAAYVFSAGRARAWVWSLSATIWGWASRTTDDNWIDYTNCSGYKPEPTLERAMMRALRYARIIVEKPAERDAFDPPSSAERDALLGGSPPRRNLSWEQINDLAGETTPRALVIAAASLDFAAPCSVCGSSIMSEAQNARCPDESACAHRALYNACDKVIARLGWLGVDFQDDRAALRDALAASRSSAPTSPSLPPAAALAARLYEEASRRLARSGTNSKQWAFAADSERQLWLVLAAVVREIVEAKPDAAAPPPVSPYAVNLDDE